MNLFTLILLPLRTALSAPALGRDTYEKQTRINVFKVPAPPHFVHRANKAVVYFTTPEYGSQKKDDWNYYYSEEAQLLLKPVLRCAAVGFPAPRYNWQKDGKPFPLEGNDRIVRDGETDAGTFSIKNPKRTDAGVYQCTASNPLGTAIDDPVQLTFAYLDEPTNAIVSYSGYERVNLDDLETVIIKSLESYSRTFYVNSVPASWVSCDWTGDKDDERIAIVEELGKASIHFTYVTLDDSNQVLICGVNFFWAWRLYYIFKFDVQKRDLEEKAGHSKLHWLHRTEAEVVMHEDDGREFFRFLHCIYGGYPMVPVYWYFTSDAGTQDSTERKALTETQQLPDGVYQVNGGKSLHIRRNAYQELKEAAGFYRCQVGNGTELQSKIWLRVESAPKWLDKPPRNINTTISAHEEVHCNVTGKPKPAITFYKNGQRIRNNDVGYQIVETVGGKKLVMESVIGGHNGSGHTAVYQCGAENRHGKVWANFYVNVLGVGSPDTTTISQTTQRQTSEKDQSTVAITAGFTASTLANLLSIFTTTTESEKPPLPASGVSSESALTQGPNRVSTSPGFTTEHAPTQKEEWVTTRDGSANENGPALAEGSALPASSSTSGSALAQSEKTATNGDGSTDEISPTISLNTISESSATEKDTTEVPRSVTTEESTEILPLFDTRTTDVFLVITCSFGGIIAIGCLIFFIFLRILDAVEESSSRRKKSKSSKGKKKKGKDKKDKESTAEREEDMEKDDVVHKRRKDKKDKDSTAEREEAMKKDDVVHKRRKDKKDKDSTSEREEDIKKDDEGDSVALDQSTED